jgi:heparan-alpha-glucosaminide N-acetyltransferase
MSATLETSLPGASPIGPEVVRAADRRVLSIDIFRGITMAVMIFVNELADIHGMPWWTRHAPARLDLMTYVDMVFPFFLFAVGMSLPLSVAQRLKRDPSLPALWLHIATRSIALITLGLILANAEKADPSRMGLSGSTWALLCLICAMLYLGAQGKSDRSKSVARIFRLVGLAGVVVLLAIFRRTAGGGEAAWLDFSYPEILGLIGISYLAVSILFVPTRRWGWASYAWLVLLLALCAFSTARWITFPGRFPLYVWPFGNGAMCSIVISGVIASSIFLDGAGKNAWPKTTAAALGFAAVALVAGRMLTPLGISKIRATPTWSLYSIGAAVLLFTLLYWVCDVKGWQRWAAAFRPAGSNTLLTYLLPDLSYFALGAAGVTYLGTHWNAGWPGVMRTTVFTALMLAIAAALTRAKVRLQL